VTAIALIGGIDPTGGAGLLRDVWVVGERAPTLEPLAVCTAITRQGHGGPAIHACTSTASLARQLARVAEHPELRAIKLGMIPSGAITLVAELLASMRSRSADARPWIVGDPVIAASDGGRLGAELDELRELAIRVDLLTPNLAERAQLEAAGPLAGVAVLCKGEPVPDRPDRIRDGLRHADGTELWFERPRLSGPDPRGTGCALASAIACELALGRSLVTAVVSGIAWLDGARRRVHPGPDGRMHLRFTSRPPESHRG
jgi:hydroxymethylpyrimidine/phosphomethylpyrimidine kinase